MSVFRKEGSIRCFLIITALSEHMRYAGFELPKVRMNRWQSVHSWLKVLLATTTKIYVLGVSEVLTPKKELKELESTMSAEPIFRLYSQGKQLERTMSV